MKETMRDDRGIGNPAMSSEARIIHLTPGGYRRLVARIEAARRDYFAVCAETEVAAESGDTSVWHDNFAFEENTRQKHQAARRVRDLEAMRDACRVHDLPTGEATAVRLGTVVTIRLEDGSEQAWFLAGWDDGDPAAGRVAYNAGLGRALIGKEVGDDVRWGPPESPRLAEVVAIRCGTAQDDEGAE
ncbi:MAG TPA: GreA/GreB family elongation factor [Myxococcota bacterium]|nr:GreA/GreB family elongation factor [Myxococcota bacterium]HQK51563.1 GreA/GreB family elongation factor [Myxococcota bacterium]